MMDQEAVVARIDGDCAYVELGGSGGCGRCHEAGGCQGGILAQLFRDKPRQYRIYNNIGAAPGDVVVVRVANGEPLRAAFLTYLLPVLLLLLGAAAGTVLGNRSDATAALGALVGFAIAVLAGLIFRRTRIGQVAEPVLVRHSPSLCPLEEACR